LLPLTSGVSVNNQFLGSQVCHTDDASQGGKGGGALGLVLKSGSKDIPVESTFTRITETAIPARLVQFGMSYSF
jgi:hypothetical protein